MPRVAALAVAAVFAVMAYFFLRGEPRVLEAVESPPSIEEEQPQEAIIDATEANLVRSEIQAESPVMELPTEEPHGLSLVGILPDGSEVTPDRVDGYRGAKPRLWLPGPEGIRVDPEDHESLFFNAAWRDEDGQLWSGEGWFDLSGVERIEIPMTPAALQLTGVVRQAGEPVAGADVHLSDQEARFATQTDEQGRFSLVLPRSEAECLLTVGYIHAHGLRMELDLSDGEDRYVELELPAGGLEVKVIPPQDVILPPEFTVTIVPKDPGEALSRWGARHAPVREGGIARFAALPAGDYRLTVGTDNFKRGLLSSLDVSPVAMGISIGVDLESVEVILPAATSVSIIAHAESSPNLVHGLVYFERLDTSFTGPWEGYWPTGDDAKGTNPQRMAPGKYRFIVNGFEHGHATFEAEVFAGQRHEFSVDLQPPFAQIDLHVEEELWLAMREIRVLDSEGRPIGKFNCHNGTRITFSFGNGEERVHDSAEPKLLTFHLPKAAEYTFYGVPKGYEKPIFLGTHYLNGTRSELTLQAQN